MRSVALIAWYELHRLFLTKRGLLSLSTFALVWFLILRYFIYSASQLLGVSQMVSTVGWADDRKPNKYLNTNYIVGLRTSGPTY